MTVETTALRQVSGTGNGAVGQTFSGSFKIFSKNDLLVYLESSVADVFVAKTLDVDYSVAFDTDDSTFTVTTLTAFTSGKKVAIVSQVEASQGLAVPREGKIPSAAQETALDRLTLLVQDVSERVSRAILCPRVPLSPPSLSLPLVSERAGKYLAFDADGLPIAAAGSTADTVTVSTFAATLLDDASAGAFGKTLRDALVEELAPASGDDVLFYDASAALLRRVPLSSFIPAGFIKRADLATGAVALWNTQDKTASFTASVNDDYYNVDAASGAVTVTLPAASAAAARPITIHKGGSDFNAVTIQRAGSDTIMGRTSIALYVPGQSVTLVPKGTDFRVVNETEGIAEYTPTLTGFGTCTAVEFFAKARWNWVEIMGMFTTGTPTATEARISLPGSMASASGIGAKMWAGRIEFDSCGINEEYANALIVGSATYFTFARGGDSSFAQLTTNMNGNAYLGAGFKCGVKCATPL